MTKILTENGAKSWGKVLATANRILAIFVRKCEIGIRQKKAVLFLRL